MFFQKGFRKYLKSDYKLIKNSGTFDEPWYRAQYPDVDMLQMDPIEHYLFIGARLGRNPSRHFDTRSYLDINQDVAASGINPLLHYILYGRGENRQITRESLTNTKHQRNPPQDEISRKDYIDSLESFYSSNIDKIKSQKVSVIIPTYNRAKSVCEAVNSVVNQTHQNFEIFVCNDGSTDNTVDLIRSKCRLDPRIKLINLPKSHVSVTRNAGLDSATGDYIAFLDSDNVWRKDYLRYMLCVCLMEKVNIAYSGLVAVDSSGKQLFTRGEVFDREKCRRGNYIDLNVYFYKKTLETDIRFDPLLKRTVDWDFILNQTIGQKVAYAPFVGCTYAHDVKDNSRISVTQPNIYRAVVRARHSAREPIPNSRLHAVIRFQIAVKIPAPRNKAAEWGDYHFAQSLCSSLSKLGHTTRIDFLEDWHDNRFEQADDVVIVLRGLSRYTPHRAAINVMWNISHPDQVGYDEYDEFDLVYSASQSYASLLKEISSAPVKTLYQATDIERFNPTLKSKSPWHDVLFVGNSRAVYRDIVRWSIDSGHSPDIYGTRWESFVPPEFIKGTNIVNKDLGKHYASAKVVLNDHWESMREYGLLSNRLFDCIACNTAVVSDRVPSISSVFGDAVIQVSSPDDLSSALTLRGSDYRSAIAEAGEFVRTHHNFDVRAKTIVNDVLRIVGIPMPDEPLPSPFIQKQSPIKVALVAPWNGKHFQSSMFLRLLCPFTSETNANLFDVACFRPEDAHQIGKFDVAVFQRTVIDSVDEAQKIIECAEKSSTHIITDVDDGFVLIDDSHPEFHLYKPKNESLNMFIQNSRESWFSTDYLSNAYSHISKNPVVVENCLDPRIWRDYRKSYKPFQSDKTRLLYMGTATHDADFSMIFDELEHLSKGYPGSFDLTIIGAVRKVPHRPWIRTQHVPVSESMYPRFVRWLIKNNQFDIGLAPLVDNEFNRCKSDLKILDYAAAGIIPVVSDGTSYRKTASDHKCAFIAKPGTWSEAILHIHENKLSGLELLSRAQSYLWDKRHVSHSAKIIKDRLISLV